MTQRFTGYKDPDVDAGEKHSMFLDSLIVQFASPQQDAEKLIRKTLAEVDPKLPVFRFAPYDSIVAENFTQDRLIARLTSAFGFVALLLASVGLYGVMSYSVTRRTSEIGIRMAIGAKPGDVLRMILGQGMVFTAIGVGAGLAIAFFASRALGSFVVGVSPHDPAIFVGVPVILAAVMMAACWLPARRAARIDPTLALRQE
jgi:ABC-type antimicrobial peptide transport system permease subunit